MIYMKTPAYCGPWEKPLADMPKSALRNATDAMVRMTKAPAETDHHASLRAPWIVSGGLPSAKLASASVMAI
jgi:hypothetical protein